MAFPVILVNSATGSDAAASGAGPATALTGSSASTNGAGTTVTLDGSPDLTNVATDGSAVFYFADSTSGNRNFAKITGKDNTAKTVTVAEAFGASLSGKSWAIGGKRASIRGTDSYKLIENNSGNGDAMPGWIIELESAHSETISAQMIPRRAGDVTNGPITLRGASGAATKPVLRITSNINTFNLGACVLWHFEDFEVRAESSGVLTAFLVSSGSSITISGITLSRTSTNVFTTGVSLAGGAVLQNSDITGCTTGVATSGAAADQVIGCKIHDNASHGINHTGGDSFGVRIAYNLIVDNGGDGIRSAYSTSGTNRSLSIEFNTIDGNTSDGIEFSGADAVGLSNLRLENNLITSNGGYGVNFSSGSAPTLLALQTRGASIRGNNFHGNTSGHSNPSGIDPDNPGLDPEYVGSGDYTPTNTDLEGTAYPVTLP